MSAAARLVAAIALVALAACLFACSSIGEPVSIEERMTLFSASYDGALWDEMIDHLHPDAADFANATANAATFWSVPAAFAGPLDVGAMIVSGWCVSIDGGGVTYTILLEPDEPGVFKITEIKRSTDGATIFH